MLGRVPAISTDTRIISGRVSCRVPAISTDTRIISGRVSVLNAGTRPGTNNQWLGNRLGGIW